MWTMGANAKKSINDIHAKRNEREHINVVVVVSNQLKTYQMNLRFLYVQISWPDNVLVRIFEGMFTKRNGIKSNTNIDRFLLNKANEPKHF